MKAWFAWLCVVVGCGGTVAVDNGEPIEPPTKGAVGAVGSGGAGGTAVAVGGAGGEGRPSFCGEACASILDGSCFDAEQCAVACASLGSASPTTESAFRYCAAEDPLCFISVEGCMLNRLTPTEGVSYELEGVGFEAYEGAEVRIRVVDAGFPGPLDLTTAVDGGRFGWRGDEPVPSFGDQGPLVQLFVDVDGDGVCGPSDFTHSDWMTWQGNFDDIVYRLALGPSDEQAPWVCSQL